VNYALFVVAGWNVAGALLVIGNIGKTRKPTTPGTAVVGVIIAAAMVTVLVLAALELK
jgi:hypothetical protein